MDNLEARRSDLGGRGRQETRMNTTHLFTIGTWVHFKASGPALNRALGAYEILDRLPGENGQLQYRLKSALERYQRIAKEADLAPHLGRP
jgi:hypothetical protein